MSPSPDSKCSAETGQLVEAARLVKGNAYLEDGDEVTYSYIKVRRGVHFILNKVETRMENISSHFCS